MPKAPPPPRTGPSPTLPEAKAGEADPFAELMDDDEDFDDLQTTEMPLRPSDSSSGTRRLPPPPPKKK